MPSVLTFESNNAGDHLTHRLFRYPAKFHPPVARALVTRFSAVGDTVFDPFCGSGTVMVEASVSGRHSVGSDIDPLAVEVSVAKTTRLDHDELGRALHLLQPKMDAVAAGRDYSALTHTDLSDEQFADEIDGLWVPEIPRLQHWFRRYVVVDLAKMLAAIENVPTGSHERQWLRVVFASILRNASNADPVPVSGLEVTSHMKRLDEAGRIVDPVSLFHRASRRALKATAEYAGQRDHASTNPQVVVADARGFSPDGEIDVIITSPPYQNAVDYYRRHQLEMFWLGLTKVQNDRLEILPRYIGKHRVAASHPSLSADWEPTPLASHWLDRISEVNEQRARDLRAYLTSMHEVFARWSSILTKGKKAVCVVGRSTWNGADLPTEQLFTELGGEDLRLAEHLTYPVRNRYMSYARRNGADIAEEHVLVLERV